MSSLIHDQKVTSGLLLGQSAAYGDV